MTCLSTVLSICSSALRAARWMSALSAPTATLNTVRMACKWNALQLQNCGRAAAAALQTLCLQDWDHADAAALQVPSIERENAQLISRQFVDA